MESLADFLGLRDPAPEAAVPPARLEDIDDPKAFAQAVLNSREFRQYIINGLMLGELPSAVLIRVMDLAGWQKPPDRHEHTGKNGQPIETVTIVRRVLVRMSNEEEESDPVKYATH